MSGVQESSAGPLALGIDTGGTFTDLVALGADGSVRVAKAPSTPTHRWARWKSRCARRHPDLAWRVGPRPAGSTGTSISATTMVEVDWDPIADFGGSSWVQSPDGDILCVYYTADEIDTQASPARQYLSFSDPAS